MSPEDSKPHSSRHVVRNLLRMMLRNAVSLAGVALACPFFIPGSHEGMELRGHVL